MGDDVLGRNPLDGELDSIWKVPKKVPSISGQSASSGDSRGMDDDWKPLSNNNSAEPDGDFDYDTGYDILAGAGDTGETFTSEAVAAEESVQLVGFRLGFELYGIDIMEVQEIIRNLEITRVPRAVDFVKGVVNLRGKVIPVISLRGKFRFEEEEVAHDKVRIIIVNIESGGLVGFEVDEVTEVIRLQKNLIAPPPPSSSRAEMEYISGVGRIGEQLIVVLNLGRMVATTKMTLDVDNSVFA